MDSYFSWTERRSCQKNKIAITFLETNRPKIRTHKRRSPNTMKFTLPQLFVKQKNKVPKKITPVRMEEMAIYRRLRHEMALGFEARLRRRAKIVCLMLLAYPAILVLLYNPKKLMSDSPFSLRGRQPTVAATNDFTKAGTSTSTTSTTDLIASTSIVQAHDQDTTHWSVEFDIPRENPVPTTVLQIFDFLGLNANGDSAENDEAKEASHEQQEKESQNPTMYGWVPSQYPNPVKNPIRCAVAYVEDSNSTALDPPYLCDPDWLLGSLMLKELLVRLDNFTGSTVGDLSVGVAIVRKMNVPLILQEEQEQMGFTSYYTSTSYPDDTDRINQAANSFSHSLYREWFSREHVEGILIFLSVQDHVCFIQTGQGLYSLLPWWRLDHVVSDMKPALAVHEYGSALLTAVDRLESMIRDGPPTFRDRIHDFMTRFGVMILFSIFTLVFGVLGEYRDRQKRFEYAEERSKLLDTDREKASLLQHEYHTEHCPICLESFSYGSSHEDPKYGIPRLGADGQKIKLLRCGHIFCETCWKAWVHSGCGNPCKCPVCREDCGRKKTTISQSSRRLSLSSDRTSQSGTASPSSRTPLLHPTFDLVSSTRRQPPQSPGNSGDTHATGISSGSLLDAESPPSVIVYNSFDDHSSTRENA